MFEVQVRHHVRVGNEIIRVQKTQRGGLHRPAEIQRRFLECVGQIGDDHFADGLAERTVEDETERAFGIVLADEDDGALEERTAKLSAVEQQLAFEKFEWRWHGLRLESSLNLPFLQLRQNQPSDLTFFTIAAASMPNLASSSSALPEWGKPFTASL